MMLHLASTNTLLQTIAEESKRGRVMSPFGSLIAGGLGSAIGAPATLVLSGSVCLAGAVLFARRLPTDRRLVRPILRELGIIPQLAEGIQNASDTASRKVVG
jgi:hypothetical protein